MNLVLSLFPGVGLLDMAFERAGWCVVRGPDLLWGGDVRRFRPPAGCWAGVIGGPPCQDFSAARRSEPTGDGLEMLREFARVVSEAQPDWWLAENVPAVPDITVEGYTVQRLPVEQSWYVPIRRHRVFQWGRHERIAGESQPLDIPRRTPIEPAEDCVLASDSRPWPLIRRLQGLPDDYDLPGFSDAGRRRAVGNGVALPLGHVVAAAVSRALGHRAPPAESHSSDRRVTAQAVGESQASARGVTVSAAATSQPSGESHPPCGPVTELPRCSVCGVVVTGGRRTCSDRCRQQLSRLARGLIRRPAVGRAVPAD